MTGITRFIRSALSILVVLATLSSCGFRDEGYAVILWSDLTDQLKNGSVARVVERSQINDTVTLRLPDSRVDVVLDPWRLRIFESEQEAEAYAEQIAPFGDEFALAARNALPVREEPDRMSSIVYRLREGEEMRILTRSDEPSDEAGFVDYWYEVLTQEGVAGWVFGYFLDIPSDTPEQVEEDPKLATILSTVWRPVFFSEMIQSGRFDLDRFRPEFGLFPYPEEQRFDLRLPGTSVSFTYDEIANAAANEYVVRDTSLQITYRNENTISIQYSVEGEGSNIAMERVEADIEEIIQAERERRRAIREELVERGPVLRSDSYGTIRLDADGSLRWTGFSALVPRVIPAGAPSEGRLEFDLYVSERFADRYDGAATLTLGQGEGSVEVPLLYVYTSSGIRLIPLSDQEIRRNLVISEPLSPLVLFFSFSS
jgi:hypothetical protein